MTDGFISIDGTAIDRVTNTAAGNRRWPASAIQTSNQITAETKLTGDRPAGGTPA